MRTIKRTSQFRRDFKRVKRGVHGSHVDETLEAALDLLAADAVLPARYEDHQLKGQHREYRDCHLRADLVLVYGKWNSDTLELVRIGSHAQLGL